MLERSEKTRSTGVRKVGRFSIDFEVANYGDILRVRENALLPEKVRRLSIRGVVDPGSAKLVLPLAMAKQLDLPVTGKVRVRYADGRSALRNEVEGVYVTILGRGGPFKAILERKRDTALIGAIILENLDFLVDNGKQRLVPRDPDYVVSEIE